MGTDVRLELKLDELSDFDNTSIKQLRCYVIRKEDVGYVNLDSYGYPQYYSPTDYDLMYTCMCNNYNWLPYNQEVYNSGMFGPIDDYRYFPAYNGFGVRSKQFKIIPDKYLAASRVLQEKNKIEMYFPAQDQKKFGEYIVVVVVTVYQPGWGSNNLRTFTINKGVMFEIVDEYTTQKPVTKYKIEKVVPEDLHLNISNIPTEIEDDEILSFRVSGMILGSSPIKVHLVIKNADNGEIITKGITGNDSMEITVNMVVHCNLQIIFSKYDK